MAPHGITDIHQAGGAWLQRRTWCYRTAGGSSTGIRSPRHLRQEGVAVKEKNICSFFEEELLTSLTLENLEESDKSDSWQQRGLSSVTSHGSTAPANEDAVR